MSLDESLARPEREDGLREELIQGEVIVSPNVTRGHSEIVRRLHRLLRSLEKQSYVVVTNFACLFAETATESLPNPDLGVVHADRWDSVDSNKWLEQAPALTIEVASPGNRKLHVKAALYMEHGAEQVWTVFPKTRTVAVLTAEGTREARVGEAVEFSGVRINVSDIFA